MADTTPHSLPQEPGRWRAIGLAVAVHAALFVFLWVGIRWQSETPVALEAEVWDMQAKDAAPKQSVQAPEPPTPVPEPKPRPEPEPVSKPAPKPAAQAPVEKPEIALEQERKKKEKAKREEEERLARLKEEKEQAQKEKEKQAALKKQQEQATLEKQKADALDKKKKADAEKKLKQEAQLDKLAAQTRAEEMKRITGATAGSGGSGTAAKTQGMRGDAGYAGKVAAKIKSNTAFAVPPGLEGNPTVEYDVQLFPDGSLRGAPRKVKSSGIPAFDDAVRRAIELSAPFPADKSGTVPSGFPVIHRPKEQ